MRELTFGSVFSGIGGFEEGFRRAGARCLFSAEIDPRCRVVLRRHFPGVPRFHDVHDVTGAGLRAAGLVPDVLVGGFPCQGLSVAGERRGLEGDTRSNLFHQFARIAEEARPEWVVVENVPGLLSSGGRRDMGTVLRVLADIGYLGAWRVLDAQYFGVAQRRRRVFLVGRLGDRTGPAEVLLEPEGGGGDPPARSAAGQVAPSGTGNGSASGLVPAVANALDAPSTGGQRNDQNGPTLVPVAFHVTQDPISETNGSTPAMSAGNRQGCGTLGVAYNIHAAWSCAKERHAYETERARSLDSSGGFASNQGGTVAVQQMAVRRLTPTECERLMGFPDGWTEGHPDSARYRMLGNAVVVNVAEWLAHRLVEVALVRT